MIDLYIPKSKYTPEIQFLASGTLWIKGMSLLEDSQQLYSEVADWLRKFGEGTPCPAILNLKFDHLDTSSVRSVVDLIKIMNQLSELGFRLTINWYYEKADEDLFEIGEAIRSTCQVDFNLIETQIDDFDT